MSFPRRSLRLVSALFIGAFFVCSSLLQTSFAAPTAPDTGAMAGRLRADVTQLTRLASRAPGTPGNAAAADYVLKRFQEIGLQQVKAESYQVTAPVTKSSTLAINGKSYSAYPLYPNGVAPSSTPPDGITGGLIYADPNLPVPQAFNGRQVKGAIVALDFNSGMDWLTAADLGARAIIFLEPTPGTDPTLALSNRGEAERKFSALPVELPRYYVRGAAADAIRAAGSNSSATVKSAVQWDRVPVRNIIGTIRGTDAEYGKQTVVVDGYYDSMSVAPDYAPGAEAAGNCAALFELAAYFKAHPPKYTLMFVANGAHHMALAGARNFAGKHFIDATGKATSAEKAETEAISAFVGIDITSRTSTVGLFAKSWFYNQMTAASENLLLNQYFDFAKAMYAYAETEASRQKVRVGDLYVDGIRGLSGRSWRSYLTSLVALDSEVATMAQKAGISFVTANDGRILQDTPFDTPNFINYSNLTQEIGTISTLLTRSLNSTPAGKQLNDFQALPTKKSLSANFGYAVGRAIYRNTTEGTSFLPNSPLPDEHLDAKKYPGVRTVGYVLDRSAQYKSYSGVRGAFVECATYSKAKKGFPASAQFIFLGPRVGDTKGGGTPPSEIEAYAVDAQGRVIYAPDKGIQGVSFASTFTSATPSLSYKDPVTGEINVNATTLCFASRGVAFVDTLDQRYFTILREATILDAKTDSDPTEYGVLKPMAPAGVSEVEPIAIVYGRVGSRFKMTMQQGLLGKRLVLLGTEPGNAVIKEAQYNGLGIAIPAANDPGTIYPHLAYSVARDLWTLDQERVALLKSFGISNERVQTLHVMAGGRTPDSISAPVGGAIEAADKELAALRYDGFYREARRGFGLESRAYPDVEATSQDVLKGILFYLALLLPFSFFLERLLFGSPDIRRQILWTGGLFLAVFVIISQVHPAFKLAPTPLIILLAFIILALTVVVTMFLSGKFEAEIKRMKQGVHFADVGRLSAISAALGLGIANMRRRPTRTALTCVTLILLTFTVLSFTSVTASISNFARVWGNRPPTYAGMVVRQADWSPLQDRVVDSLSNEFRQKFNSAPALRAWYLSRDQGETLQLRVSNSEDPNRYFHAPALLGMTAEEASIGSPVVGTVLKGGRWFQPGERNVCLLPKSILVPPQDEAGASGKTAAGSEEEEGEPKDGLLLGLTVDNAVGKTVQMAGLSLKVIGVFDDSRWTPTQGATSMRDLDDEAFTPVDYQSDQNKQNASANDTASQKGGAVQIQTYQHMRANALLLLPYETVVSIGGTPRSIAVGFNNKEQYGTEELQALLNRAALGVFGATHDANNGGVLTTRLYSSVESTSYAGFASLVVPILIAALIIANTMLGSVFERTKEIGIYSSVGLAPIHVAALFIAEAAVYAVLGSISGYLVAQTVAKIITMTGSLQGITLNYSSSSAVISTLIVMATVLLSTLYPAIQASRMSQPDRDSKWQMGEPLGDLWRFQFPFTVSGQQPVGVAEFLADFFETHTDTSVGSFYTDRVNLTSLQLREGITMLNRLPEGITLPAAEPVETPIAASATTTDGKKAGKAPAPLFKMLDIANIAADPGTEVYRLAMRVWLAPFDMGVSQDVDILLMPSDEPGLYELQLRLLRQSGEISAWKRVNRQFLSDLRRQLLLWRTIKPENQQEYVLRGRAHVSGSIKPVENPGGVVAAAV